MAISALIGRGIGSFGGVNYIPTKGYTPAILVLNKIKLSFSGYLLNESAVSGFDLKNLSVAGKVKTALSLGGVFRYE